MGGSLSVVNDPATFGGRTRLTVLEADQEVNHPTVTVFELSDEEIRAPMKATIVCLASGFFSDYVKFSWAGGNEEIETKDVLTDRQVKDDAGRDSVEQLGEGSHGRMGPASSIPAK
ncbi:T cell receptor beta chain MC.7.G5-like [Heterodontus francisci]|uniref:T cell receptor beta chain MC.7.G5-like n=1 Tax=Heterodontus francisci TaxID=7792 RepID=UPI00355C4432